MISKGHDVLGPPRRTHTRSRAINQAENLGFARITWSIIPASFDFYWQPPAHAYDPAQARRLLAEAGYPNGFDAGDYFVDAAFINVAESGIGLGAGYAFFSAPYEDVKLKGK